MERLYTITTPQNVEFTFRIAGLPSRALAWLVDILLMIAAVIVGLVLIMVFWGAFFALQEGFTILFLVIIIGYSVFFETRWKGQTPGKRVLGLRVIRDDGTALDFRAVLVRNLLRLFDGFPRILILPTMVLGGVVASFNERCKRLGDWAAETMVVQVARTRVPQGFQATRGAYNSLREDAMLVDRIRRTLTLPERELLIDLCVRSDEIELEHRVRLFENTADYLCPLLGIELPEHMSHEKLIQNLTDILLEEVALRA